MSEDIFRFLCNAIFKLTDGEPVTLSKSEAWDAFELKLEEKDGGLVVQVIENFDEDGLGDFEDVD